jgi:transposase InsO family protein
MAVRTLLRVANDVLQLASIALRSRAQLAAENLFLRKQLALYIERRVKPRRADDATRIVLVAVSRLVDWPRLLIVVKLDTLIRWHRKGFRLFWRSKSKCPGRPRVPAELQRLIEEMATANRTWGEERIAAELLLKLGIRVSPRTVRRYMSRGDGAGGRPGSQRWSTFIQNHARAVLACDFFVAVTLRFQLLYVFVVLEVETRRVIHWNLTDEPTAEWTLQQLRMATPGNAQHRFLIHDRDSIFSREIDGTLTSTGLTILKTPVRVPQANAHCERLIGTMRRECLDWMIPFGEIHLRRILHDWVRHYNRGRPHSSLGPGIPEPPTVVRTGRCDRHHFPAGHRVTATPILSGLHHEYRLEAAA